MLEWVGENIIELLGLLVVAAIAWSKLTAKVDLMKEDLAQHKADEKLARAKLEETLTSEIESATEGLSKTIANVQTTMTESVVQLRGYSNLHFAATRDLENKAAALGQSVQDHDKHDDERFERIDRTMARIETTYADIQKTLMELIARTGGNRNV